MFSRGANTRADAAEHTSDPEQINHSPRSIGLGSHRYARTYADIAGAIMTTFFSPDCFGLQSIAHTARVAEAGLGK